MNEIVSGRLLGETGSQRSGHVTDYYLEEGILTNS